MAKIRKKSCFSEEKSEEKLKNYNSEIKKFSKNIAPFSPKNNISLFSHRDKILAVKNAEIITTFLEKMYFMRLGETIGFWEHNAFSPSARAFRDIDVKNTEILELKTEEEIDEYLRGGIFAIDSEKKFVLIEAK